MHHIKTEKSSQLFSFGFDPVEERLCCRFRCRKCSGTGKNEVGGSCGPCRGTGHTGDYVYTPETKDGQRLPLDDAYRQLREAHEKGESVGAAHNTVIKKAGYKFTFTPHGSSASA